MLAFRIREGARARYREKVWDDKAQVFIPPDDPRTSILDQPHLFELMKTPFGLKLAASQHPHVSVLVPVADTLEVRIGS